MFRPIVLTHSIAPARRPSRILAVERLEDRSLLASDMVLQWNAVLLDAIREDLTAPPVAARNMAIVHAAVYDAVNAIEQTHEPYVVSRRAPPGASAEAAVAAAAHRTLVELFPAQSSTFDAALANSLAAIADGPAENKGVALGRSVAQQILANRRHDGADAAVEYTIGSEPGYWQPTPPAFIQSPALPQWPAVQPFAMHSGSQFLPPPPPSLSSAEYAAAFEQVEEIGAADSPDRTADQTEIAWFWVNGPGTATPPGHWNEAAQVAAETAGNTLAENARLFALLNIALADAGISCWDAKYEYDFWRPVTAIRAADSDGNPATDADAQWTSLIPTPPFPAYTSGHSTFSAAAAAVLADFFGGDSFAFTLASETPAAQPRTYAGFFEAAAESGMSRIYGGIHWSFDNDWALAAGAELGHFVFENYLRPSEEMGHSLDSLLTLARSDAAQNGTLDDLARALEVGIGPPPAAVAPPLPSPGRGFSPQAATRVAAVEPAAGDPGAEPNRPRGSSTDEDLDAFFAELGSGEFAGEKSAIRQVRRK